MINFNTEATNEGGNTMKVTLFKRLTLLLFTTSAMMGLPISSALSHSVMQPTELISVIATNPLNQARQDAQVWIPTSVIPNYNPALPIVVINKGSHLPSEVTSKTMQSDKEQILVITSFTANQSKTLTIHQPFNGRPETLTSTKTYAELAVRVGGTMDDKGLLTGGQYVQMTQYQLPSDHSIGNKLMKYEGLGWESELIGYRYYYDNRGAIDIFGKQINALALKEVGLDGGNYHALQNWGMDVLKVNNSVGIGAPAAVINNRLVKVTDFASSRVEIQNSALFSQIDLFHQKWKVANTVTDLHTRFRIFPGSALTDVSTLSSEPIDTWGTGIVNHQVHTIESDGKSTWCYLASFGEQSLNKDLLGLAIFYPCKDKREIVSDNDNIAVHLAPNHTKSNGVDYKFSARWQAETNGPDSLASFSEYLETTVRILNSPIVVSLVK